MTELHRAISELIEPFEGLPPAQNSGPPMSPLKAWFTFQDSQRNYIWIHVNWSTPENKWRLLEMMVSDDMGSAYIQDELHDLTIGVINMAEFSEQLLDAFASWKRIEKHQGASK